MIPGEVRVSTEPLEFGTDAEKITMVVVNDGDRPIQIGSHLHLPAANPALTFDREAADGFRLDIPSGTSVRFEPGVSRTVTLIALGGLKGFRACRSCRTKTYRHMRASPRPSCRSARPASRSKNLCERPR